VGTMLGDSCGFRLRWVRSDGDRLIAFLCSAITMSSFLGQRERKKQTLTLEFVIELGVACVSSAALFGCAADEWCDLPLSWDRTRSSFIDATIRLSSASDTPHLYSRTPRKSRSVQPTSCTSKHAYRAHLAFLIRASLMYCRNPSASASAPMAHSVLAHFVRNDERAEEKPLAGIFLNLALDVATYATDVRKGDEHDGHLHPRAYQYAFREHHERR
jgi:hypothetical protein